MWAWIGITAGVVSLGILIYWLFVVTEGTYLGQRVVTWLYDITANRYDDIKQFDAEIEAQFLGKPLVTALQSELLPLILDIGTGTGRLPLTVFDQSTFQGRIIGLDHSREMLRVAAGKLEPHADRLTLIWHDAMRLPFPDNAFDAVSCLEMLEFTPDPAGLLTEAVRVLRPGGLLLTTRRTGFDAKLLPGKTFSGAQFVHLMEELGLTDVRLGWWQVDYDLAWGYRAGSAPRGPRNALEVIRCSKCDIIDWQQEPYGLVCANCGSTFQIVSGIIEMAHHVGRSPN
jgi:ubiquinone/menaquinone biosynthesis C-methylase UbiE